MRQFFGRRFLALALAAAALGTPVAAGAFLSAAVPAVPAVLARDQIFQGDYIAVGDAIELLGNVDGDVIVAASRLVVRGAVSGDVIAAASTIEITGEVEGDVRAAAMAVAISGTVGKNVNVWGNRVEVAAGATIGRNLSGVAEQFVLDGAVGRTLAVRAANLAIAGRVDGDARLNAGSHGLVTLQPSAVIAGALDFEAQAAEQLQRKAGATVGGEIRHLPLADRSAAVAWQRSLFLRTISLFGMFVVGLVLVTFAPRALHALVQQSWSRQPWLALAWGLIIVVATPLAAFALTLTVIGLPLALMIVGVYVMALYLAQVVAGISLGVWLMSRAAANRVPATLVLPMVLGLTLLMAVTTLLGPMGWLMKLLAVLWGVGALARFKVQLLAQWR